MEKTRVQLQVHDEEDWESGSDLCCKLDAGIDRFVLFVVARFHAGSQRMALSFSMGEVLHLLACLWQETGAYPHPTSPDDGPDPSDNEGCCE